jgi:UDP-glucuronate 4-epimerase
MSKILVTGVAGFIGSFVVARFAEQGDEVVGLDNINDYYDERLKFGRLKTQGITATEIGIDNDLSRENFPWYKFVKSSKWDNYRFIRMNLEDTNAMSMLFANENFDIVINLAAQAGVRYSIQNPHAYIESNIDGFINVLEGCRHNKVKHLVYASSSSVYGLNGKVPFSEKDGIAHPVSLYAATKKSNELMAHAYSKLYDLPTTGLRFFTVYGPWGRPDMSPFLFMDAILNNRPIKVFNNGDMLRDFTYIDDIVEGVVRIARIFPQSDSLWNEDNPDPSSSVAPYRIFNIGNSQPTKLMDYIQCIENAIGREAKKEFLPMQLGDVYQTYADSSALAEITGFKPCTDLQEGINKTVEWFKKFYL